MCTMIFLFVNGELNMEIKKIISIIGLSTFLWSGVASADLSSETAAMCDKVKQCALAQGGADMPPEMAQMMTVIFEQKCVEMTKPYVQATKEAGLASEAKACLDSMVAQSCAVLMNGNDNKTKECVKFEKAADKAGLKYR